MQSYIFPAVNPLTSSITSSLASSVGSDSSSPTTLSTMNAKAAPFYPGSNTVESVLGTFQCVFLFIYLFYIQFLFSFPSYDYLSL